MSTTTTFCSSCQPLSVDLSSQLDKSILYSQQLEAEVAVLKSQVSAQSQMANQLSSYVNQLEQRVSVLKSAVPTPSLTPLVFAPSLAPTVVMATAVATSGKNSYGKVRKVRHLLRSDVGDLVSSHVPLAKTRTLSPQEYADIFTKAQELDPTVTLAQIKLRISNMVKHQKKKSKEAQQQQQQPSPPLVTDDDATEIDEVTPALVKQEV
jgi:hypothetical protein